MLSNMKVIYFFNELKYSGAEIMYVDAAPILKKAGYELTVVNTAHKLGEYASAFERAGYEVLHWEYPKGVFQRWRYYRRVIKHLRQGAYDVVHIHNTGLKWGISLCAWWVGCKPIYTFHNVYPSNWYSYLYHCWLRWSAKHIFRCTFQTISDSVYNNEKNFFHNETIKIYNWYGNNRFFPAKEGEKEKARKELDIPDNALVIISIGGCSHIKRHTDIIKALPNVIKEIPSLLYLHLGEGKSLSEEINLAESLDVTPYIRFCGNQREVRKYLIASDIYVMPSKHEGMSITTIECMGTQIPAILYDVPGLRDYNKEKECSFLIPEDVDILAKSIIELSRDEDKQSMLIKNAKEFVDTSFNMEKNVSEILKLYSSK